MGQACTIIHALAAPDGLLWDSHQLRSWHLAGGIISPLFRYIIVDCIMHIWYTRVDPQQVLIFYADDGRLAEFQQASLQLALDLLPSLFVRVGFVPQESRKRNLNSILDWIHIFEFELFENKARLVHGIVFLSSEIFCTRISKAASQSITS